MKFYGAGVASSVKEMENFISNKNYRKLDLTKSFPPTEYVIQDLQPFFYYIEAFEEYKEQLELLIK